MQKSAQQILKRKGLRHRFYFFLFIAFAGLVIAACVSTITSIDQPAEVKALDVAHITIGIQWKENAFDQTKRQVIGICVPKRWQAASNTVMSITSDLGPSSMSVIPAGTKEPSSGLEWPAAFLKKFGIGPNYIDDMEWVVFWSDNKFLLPNQTLANGTVTMDIKTSDDNLQFKPGYAMCEDDDGLSDANTGYYTSTFGTCLAVTGSSDEGDVQDFCNPQIGVNEPASATGNDIVTIRYNGTLDTTALSSEADIYLCSKLVTNEGLTTDMCTVSDATKMKQYDTKKWRIDLWPKKFYNIPAGQTVKRIEYFFTNGSGTLRTGYGYTDAPFLFNFKCK